MWNLFRESVVSVIEKKLSCLQTRLPLTYNWWPDNILKPCLVVTILASFWNSFSGDPLDRYRVPRSLAPPSAKFNFHSINVGLECVGKSEWAVASFSGPLLLLPLTMPHVTWCSSGTEKCPQWLPKRSLTRWNSRAMGCCSLKMRPTQNDARRTPRQQWGARTQLTQRARKRTRGSNSSFLMYKTPTALNVPVSTMIRWNQEAFDYF